MSEYILVSGNASLYAPIKSLANFFENGCLDMQSYVESQFEKTYSGYISNTYGRFLMLKNITGFKCSTAESDLNLIKIDVNFNAYFMRIYEKIVVDVPIKNVSKKGLYCNLLGYSIDVHEKDLVAGVSIEFDTVNNAFNCPSLKTTFKAGDYLRVKILNKHRVIGQGSVQKVRFKAASKYAGCGKKI